MFMALERRVSANPSIFTQAHASYDTIIIRDTQLSTIDSGNRTGQDSIRVHCNDLVVLGWEKMSLCSCVLSSRSYPTQLAVAC